MDDMTPEQRRENMQHIKSSDTTIELKLRKALWHEGIRYRKNLKRLPRKPDIAITKYKVAVFCDSSFWHGRDFERKKPIETNADYWKSKIQRNIEHDKEVNHRLIMMGWTVIRFWDTDINKNLEECVRTVKEAIFSAKTSL